MKHSLEPDLCERLSSQVLVRWIETVTYLRPGNRGCSISPEMLHIPFSARHKSCEYQPKFLTLGSGQSGDERLGETRKIVPYDVICVRKVHGIDAKRRYLYKRKFGSPQYSDPFVDWLVIQHERDPSFFEKARMKARKKR